jgi:hypothetical protein
VITLQPRTQTTTSVVPVTFEVQATGSLPLSYQWRVNGLDIVGETNSTYTITNPSRDIAGISCKVHNVVGDAFSNSVNLTVGILPTITKQPVTQTVSKGTKVTFSITAAGSSPLDFQWSKDGSSITGATSDTYVINSSNLSDSGSYKCTVSNNYGTIDSSSVQLTVKDNFDAGDIIISANTNNFVLRDALITKGWDKVLPVVVNVIVNSGVIVGSSSTSLPAFKVDAFPVGSVIKLTNNGYIVGAGGVPSAGYSSNGGNGGNAIYTDSDITITNNSIIGGGGGAGGTSKLYGKGGTNTCGAGGGGAGYVSGPGVVGTFTSPSIPSSSSSAGTLLNGGGGANTPYSSGGSGGDLGKNGGNSREYSGTGSSGGSAGYYVVGISHVTWATKGDVRGLVS